MRLSKAQIDEFDRQGYLFFGGAFSSAESDLPKQAARDIRRFRRPQRVAHRDFTPIEPLADDTLLELAAGGLQAA